MKTTFLKSIFGSLLVFLTLSGIAYAGDQLNQADTAWVFISSAMVMLMLPGLALYYGGMVRRKNVLGTLMHTFIALCVITIQWVVIGYSLSFGPDVGQIIGSLDRCLLLGINYETLKGSIPDYLFCVFQMMFSVFTVALISGSFAERVSFKAYVLFIFIWSTLVYDPICHWVWGGGWLGDLGVLDFAGGTVVHVSAGMAGLAAALYLKKRRGFPGTLMVPHNVPFSLLGVGLLWFGWFGFNGGRILAVDNSTSLVFINTQIAAAGGMLGWIFAEYMKVDKASALGAGSGIVSGLVAITPAASFVEPIWALVIGIAAGGFCYSAMIIKLRLGYDDSLDVFGVHAVGGAWGMLATGLFVTVGGSGLLAGNLNQVWIQTLAILVIGIYSFLVTLLIVIFIDKTFGFRVNGDIEETGLDITQHGETGYNMV